MKNWKDKVLGIFAGIGVMALLMGNYAQQPKGIWEMHIGGSTAGLRVFSINTVTGEVRKFNNDDFDLTKKGELAGLEDKNTYIVMEEWKMK